MNGFARLALVIISTVLSLTAAPRPVWAQLGLGGMLGGDSLLRESTEKRVQFRPPPDEYGRARRAAARIEHTEEFEARIEAAGERRISVAFADEPLRDVVARLAVIYQVPISLDSKGLADAAINPSERVTFAAQNIPLRAILEGMLESFDLTWTYGDERLVVTSKEKADEILTTRVYPVADLLNAYETRGLRAAKGAISYQWGPLMNMITSTIQPDAWDDNGGPGSISPFVPAASLVISQKRDVHEEIVELFVQLRREVHNGQYADNSTLRSRATIRPYPSHNLGAADQTTSPSNPGAAYAGNQQGMSIVGSLYGDRCQVRDSLTGEVVASGKAAR